MSGIPYQSKLIPYTEFIRKARKQGISYKKIADLLKEKFNIECYPNAVFSFVKARARIKPVISMLEDSEETMATEEVEDAEERPVQLPKIEEIDNMAKNQKPLGKPLLNYDIPNQDKKGWEKVQQRANTDHSKRLVTRINNKEEEINNE